MDEKENRLLKECRMAKGDEGGRVEALD